MATKTIIVPEGMEFIRDEIGYAPAVLADTRLYIAGQIGRNERRELVADKEAQFVQVFENLKRVLEAAGSRFTDLVEVTSYHTDMRDLPLYMEVRDRYMKGCYPAWTAIGAASLCGAPGYFLEVKGIAELG
ncbi:RidA family protein [Marinobacterium sediminicola]|uniref:Enamine deaminase RidA, house cleaning of reactive enamine intermediates, YjgF/YER057c/UK114 family n=1 Tax=Marinobacterium sediminicola TaxID=518898 RepID=A0ABY1S0V5_9GAMM|nr:RidA family protein [Marinobacterium sediminicola]ULG68295.1 RidA family protein [Marinobacterium sediminicola]SMR74865.1 Enamine deaminase RidA, house cleaning of reactive enamine intermediates, YjgF/YER057c/UK114 family [Marinobacterium sediminicola]